MMGLQSSCIRRGQEGTTGQLSGSRCPLESMVALQKSVAPVMKMMGQECHDSQHIITLWLIMAIDPSLDTLNSLRMQMTRDC